MSPSLLATSHSSLVTFPQRFLFNVSYHLSFPAEFVTTDCLSRDDFI